VASRYVQNAEKILLLLRERSDSGSTLSKGRTMGPNPWNNRQSLLKVVQNIILQWLHFSFFNLRSN
jgi:hypothetical protein